MIFLTASTIKPRGSRAFHIIIEEAHRYVQHDSDIELLGYNIFERIAKEGRKYGSFLVLITQRPSELSDTCVSQAMNFVLLRTLHPVDLKYIKEMVPNVSNEIVLQLKNLKPGNCIAFGSAFKVPTPLYVDLPNPRPLSNNVDLEKVWYTQQAGGTAANVQAVMQQQAQQVAPGQAMPQQMAAQPMMQPGMPQQMAAQPMMQPGAPQQMMAQQMPGQPMMQQQAMPQQMVAQQAA